MVSCILQKIYNRKMFRIFFEDVLPHRISYFYISFLLLDLNLFHLYTAAMLVLLVVLG